MLETTAGSLGELINGSIEIARKWTPTIVDPQELWFRGQSKARYPLLPGLYREAVMNLHFDEVGLFERFKLLALPHSRNRPNDEWEWYFLAQHYGLPTRLLDWTESLLAAAYFALTGLVHCQTRLEIDDLLVRGRVAPVFDSESPVVWIIDAGTLNAAAAGDDSPYVPGGELTNRYLPDQLTKRRVTNRLPLAILPARANDRIIAQQGVFTIHGHSTEPLEALHATRGSKVRLARILLDRANFAHLWEELQFAGTTKLGMFPGVDSAAEHARWIMQSVNPLTNTRRKIVAKKKKSGPKKSAKKR